MPTADEVATIARIIPVIRNFFLGEPALGCSDLETYQAYFPGLHMDHKIKVGDPVRAGGLSSRCIQAGAPVYENVGPEAFGFPYAGMAAPICDAQGKVVGTFFLLESMEMVGRRDQFLQVSSTLNSSMDQAAEISKTVQGEADEIRSLSQTLVAVTDDTTKRVNQMTGVVQVIQDLSDRTNVLGINASIEAARAGHVGYGFKVIAEEIRKLSQETRGSVAQIQVQISEIQRRFEQLKDVSVGLEKETSLIQATSLTMEKMVEQVTGGSAQVADLAEGLMNVRKTAAPNG
jgi:hypothetical protein